MSNEKRKMIKELKNLNWSDAELAGLFACSKRTIVEITRKRK